MFCVLGSQTHCQVLQGERGVACIMWHACRHHITICEAKETIPPDVPEKTDTAISSVIPQAETKSYEENTVLLQTAKAYAVGQMAK